MAVGYVGQLLGLSLNRLTVATAFTKHIPKRALDLVFESHDATSITVGDNPQPILGRVERPYGPRGLHNEELGVDARDHLIIGQLVRESDLRTELIEEVEGRAACLCGHVLVLTDNLQITHGGVERLTALTVNTTSAVPTPRLVEVNDGDGITLEVRAVIGQRNRPVRLVN